MPGQGGGGAAGTLRDDGLQEQQQRVSYWEDKNKILWKKRQFSARANAEHLLAVYCRGRLSSGGRPSDSKYRLRGEGWEIKKKPAECYKSDPFPLPLFIGRIFPLRRLQDV